MTSPVIGIAILSVIYLLCKWLYATDLPKIKGIPEIPGWPLFGSLIELGEYHAKVAQDWSKKYGPVFQVRLGNRVCQIFCMRDTLLTDHYRGLYSQIHLIAYGTSG
jgi:hypothetical protein